MIERYSSDKHRNKISRWLAERNIECPDNQDFCDFGLVVDDLVAGFLYKTNSKLCYLDDFVSDPDGDPTAKSEAWQKLISALEEEAKSSGYKYITASVNHPNLLVAFKNYGLVGDCRRFVKSL